MIDCSVITCDEVIDAADNVSTNDCFSVPVNAGNTASINCDGKKVRYKINCCILRTCNITIYSRYYLPS